jgi:hypothetical protein
MKKIILLASLAFSINAFAQVPSYVPTNGLQGWWQFSGNANDGSTNGYNGTVNGATLATDRFGNTNSSYNFNGTNNDISLPIGFTTGSASKSFSVWFYLTNGTYNFVLDGGTSVNGKSFGLFWNTNPTINKLTFHGDGATYDYEFADINFNQWYHTVITYDGTTVKSYLNGVYIGSKNATLNTSTTSNIKVGCRNNTSAYFLGKIDDIGVWNSTLTQQEITNLYNGNICYQNITVTDTLLINTNITGFNPVTYQNTIKIYPNPTNDHITIDNGNIANLTGYQIKITNSLSQQVFQSAITQQQFYVDLSTWTGNGIYFVHIIDGQGNTIDIKKIVLQ